MIPVKIREMPPAPDGYPTHTSETQSTTEKDIREAFNASADPPVLERMKHFGWLNRLLVQGLPGSYKAQDASQPWLLYWSLQAFQIMGAGLHPNMKQRAIDTAMKCQHPKGGFGGGPGQEPALLPTYAAVSSLAIVGRPGPGGGWDEIDRERMYEFFMSLKQPDGSFVVSRNAEVDVRGIYCLLVCATLLDLLTPELVAGTADFVASTQTYEGGFGSASAPYYLSETQIMDEPRPTLGEAHSGYAGCAIGAWALLQPVAGSQTPKREVNLKRFMRWLVMLQGDGDNHGGFRGRSNKLVDGCYSWWCGGALGLTKALLPTRDDEEEEDEEDKDDDSKDDEADWDDAGDDSVFDRRALQEYILCVAQDTPAGLRDKPGKHADLYHTMYCLAGLSTSQHRVFRSKRLYDDFFAVWQPSVAFVPQGGGGDADDAARDTRRRGIWANSRCWKEDEGASKYLGGPKNRVNAIHPLFTLLISHCDAMLDHFYGQAIV